MNDIQKKILKNARIIAITGTPCTGKSSLARELAKIKGYVLIDGSQIIKKNKLSEGYDSKRKAEIVDPKRFSATVLKFIQADLKVKLAKSKYVDKKALKTKKAGFNVLKTSKNINKKQVYGYVIDSHLSHFLPNKLISICIVTKTSIKILNKRLIKRYNPKNKPNSPLNSKIRENLDSEILDICHVEALEAGHRIVLVDTTKKLPISIANAIARKL